jgi:hypothetical protein
VKDVRCAGHIAFVGEKMNVCRSLMGKARMKETTTEIWTQMEILLKRILEK